MIKKKLRYRNEKGQIIVFVVISVLSLSMLWMMLINIATMVKDRIMLQNAADCAAHTAACIRARGLNMVGALNFTLGGLIESRKVSFLGIEAPGFAWIPELPASALYASVIATTDAQAGIVSTYGGGLAYLAAEKVAKAQGADGIIAEPGTFSLNLKRKIDKINFYDTIDIGLGPTPNIFCPLTKRVPTWYYLKDKKSPKKNVIIAYKNSNSRFFGKRLFGISEIPRIAAIAAARPFNKHGAMFPTKDDENLGLMVMGYYLTAADGYDAELVPVGSLIQH
jgi:hypothetical protein